jgi:hypothetical protein
MRGSRDVGVSCFNCFAAPRTYNLAAESNQKHLKPETPRKSYRARSGGESAGITGGAVANCVEIGRRVFGHDDAIRSSGEVNGLIGGDLRQGLPSVDLAHGDLP